MVWYVYKIEATNRGIMKNEYYCRLFFGRFSATLTNSIWRNLEFFKKFLEFFRKFLEFFRKFLEFIQKNGRFIQNSLKFSKFKLCLVEKLKFGQIFVQNLLTSGLF